MTELSPFQKHQRLIKTAIAATAGSINISGILFSAWLINADFFQTLLSNLRTWLNTPISLNLIGLLQLLLSLIIKLIELLLQLFFWLLSLGHSSPLNLWIEKLSDLLTSGLHAFAPPQWLTLASFAPRQIIPFSTQLLNLIDGSDAIAAMLLATLITATCTSATIWILSLDIPLYMARKLNEHRARQAHRHLQDLLTALREINFYALPAEDTEILRSTALLLIQAERDGSLKIPSSLG